MNVRGLGEKNFLKLKPQLTVGAAKADHERQTAAADRARLRLHAAGPATS